MTFEPGDIVVLPLPFTDGSRTKRRPVLVLSSKDFNDGDDLVVCAITSNPKDVRHSVLIVPEDMGEPRLPKPSRIKVAKLSSAARDGVVRVMGRVKPDVMAQVWKEFHSLFPA